MARWSDSYTEPTKNPGSREWPAVDDPICIAIFLESPKPGEGGSWDEALDDVLVLEPGESVRGTVEVEVLEAVEFREAQIRFVWYTEGRGNPVTGEGGGQTLERDGDWEAGSTHRFEFDLPAPWGPLSYEGETLQVGWKLEARLDRSLLRPEVTESIPVRLAGTPPVEMANLGPVPQEKDKLEARKRGLGGSWIALGMTLLLGGIVLGALYNWDFQGTGRLMLFLLMGGGLLLTLRGMWGRLGRGKLGEPTVQLSTTEVRRGEEVRFSVSVRPDKRTELRSLEAILECEERVVQGHGNYQTTHRRTVFQKRLSLAKDQVIDPARGLRKKGTLTLPPDGPPSFGAPHNQLLWWLRFEGNIVGWPDWKEPILLTVWP
jgi:hypothetical protein